MPYKYNPFTSNLDFYEGSTVSSPVTVAEGGTGNTTLTDGSILVGDGTNPIEQIGPLTDGQLLIGDTAGVSPASAQLTAGTGVSITNGAGSISVGLDSPVSIANGGTGASDATEGFDALAPTTTKGDLIASDGSDNVRLGVGTDDQVLTADSTQASGVKWATAAGGGDFGSQIPFFDNLDGTQINGPYIIDTNNTAGANVTTDRAIFQPVFVSADCTLDTLLVRVFTGVAGATFRLGLYDDVGGVPTNLLTESGVLSCATSSTIVESASLSYSLSRGWYWTAITVDENSGTVTINGVNNYKYPGWASISGSSIVVRNHFFKDSISPSSSFPDPVSSLTLSASNSVPTVWYKASI